MDSVRACVVDPLYCPKVGNVHPVNRKATAKRPAPAMPRRVRRGAGIAVIESVEGGEGLVNDESTEVTLSNPAKKYEVAVQSVAVSRIDVQRGSESGTLLSVSIDSWAAQLKTPRAMVEVARCARAAKT